MHEKVELFVGTTKQNRSKKFFVSRGYNEAIEAARKTLRVSRKHIFMQFGYVVHNDLYLGNPMKNGQKKVWVASYTA